MDMNMASPSYRASSYLGSPLMPPSTSRVIPGLRVLVVDDDRTSLAILEKMLMECLYGVTKCNRAEIALYLLRDNPEAFDIVISEVHLPDMDGFRLLVKFSLEMDLPLILMSADDSKEVMKIGMAYGACNYLIKPVEIEALRNITQHVLHRQKIRNSSSRKRKDINEDDVSPLNKPTKHRVVWTIELHEKFVAAVNQLGIEKATLKKILDLMNEPGLTRENVASHLQRYRLYLRRLISEDCNHQTSASTGQIPAQTSLLQLYGSQVSLFQQPRVLWSVELHQKFVSAVNQLGIDEATPEKILDLMNVPALTHENIARHLGKYRARNDRALKAQSYVGVGVPVNPFTLPGSSQARLQPSNGQHILDEAKTGAKASRGGDSQPDKPGKDHWIVELDNIVGSSTFGSKRTLFKLGFSSGQNHTMLIFFGMMSVVFWVWFVFPNLLKCSF